MPIYDQLPLWHASTQSLVGEVAENLGLPLPSAITGSAAARIVTHLNHVQKIMLRRHPWRDLEVLDSSIVVTEDRYRYALPSDCYRLIDARLIDDTPAVISRCDGDWEAGTDIGAGSTVVTDTNYFKTGGTSTRFDFNEDATGGLIAFNTIEKSGTLSTVADSTLGTVQFVADANTELSAGDMVTIAGTSNYNGSYEVLTAATTVFVIKATYTAETLSGATWRLSETVRDFSSWASGVLSYWVWSDTGLSASDFAIHLSNTTDGASAAGNITSNCPAIPKKRWTQVKQVLDVTALTTFTSVALLQGTALWTTPTENIVYIDSLHLYKESWGGQSWPLKVVDRKVLDWKAPSLDYITGSRPTVLMQSGKSFEIFRKPDDNYPIWLRYIKEPKSFDINTSNVTDVCDIENVDDVLIAGATWLGMTQRKKWDSSGQWEAQFRRALHEAVLNDEKADGWEPRMRGFSRSTGLDTSDLEVPVDENRLTGRGDVSGFYNIPI